MNTIPRAQSGKAPTLQSAREANKLIDAINTLIKTRIEPSFMGRILDEPSARVIDLSPLSDYIDEKIEEAITNNVERIVDNLGIRAVCLPDGTLTVELYSKT